MWNFDFGFVIPGSTNNWDQTIDAADEDQMIPTEVLSGNMVIETRFKIKETVIYRSKMRVYYDP